jgi:hypothetical protein
MATHKAIQISLAAFAEDRGGEVTPVRAELWFQCLDDVSDADLLRATNTLLRAGHKGDGWLPTISTVRNAAGANAKYAAEPLPAIDVEGLLARIERLGEYDYPRSYFVVPGVETVRTAIGEAEARAYGQVGATRLFSANDLTRDIARQEFTKALRSEQRDLQERGALPQLAGPEERRAHERLIPGGPER